MSSTIVRYGIPMSKSRPTSAPTSKQSKSKSTGLGIAGTPNANMSIAEQALLELADAALKRAESGELLKLFAKALDAVRGMR